MFIEKLQMFLDLTYYYTVGRIFFTSKIKSYQIVKAN